MTEVVVVPLARSSNRRVMGARPSRMIVIGRESVQAIRFSTPKKDGTLKLTNPNVKSTTRRIVQNPRSQRLVQKEWKMTLLIRWTVESQIKMRVKNPNVTRKHSTSM
jgi:hypothetical protein